MQEKYGLLTLIRFYLKKDLLPRKRKIKWQTLYIKSAIVQIIEGNIKSLMEHDAPRGIILWGVFRVIIGKLFKMIYFYVYNLKKLNL